MPTPVWIGASAGYTGLSGQINQCLTTHNSVWVYSGSAVQSSATTGAALYVTSASQYLTQSFTTGSAQTAISQVLLQISTVGGSPITATITPLVVSLYASFSGLPTGTALASVTLTEQQVYSGPFWLSIPLAATVTPSTVYQITVSPAGNGSAYYAWQQSNQTSGAATSPDNATWTQQAYGFMYQVYDNSGTTGSVTSMVDDGGARYAQFTYSGALPATITEFVQTQNGSGQTQTRTFTYSSGQLIGLS